MNTRIRNHDRAGFTLVEMIIALLIYGIVVAGALGFMSTQNSAFHRGMDRMTSLQNLRYALSTLQTNVVTLGTNLPARQPAMVYAGSDVIAFSADYASNVENDVFSSYIDKNAPAGQVTAPLSAVAIPNTSFTWPDTTYTTAAGTRSPGELIILYFAADTSTSRSDDYILWRQVNGNDPEFVARNLLKVQGTPFFRYMKRVDYTSQASALDSIPDNSLPVRHVVKMHGTSDDVGESARSDSIRAVRVTMTATNGFAGERERTVTASRIIRMPNAGFGVFSTCGDEPILGTALAATVVSLGGGKYGAQLSWAPATDETMGEQDVARYVIYRQSVPIGSDWGDPFLSIPAGQTSYTYTDQTVASGTQYRYALAAQDCTPTLSELTQSPTISIP